jgi:hypothetical protein
MPAHASACSVCGDSALMLTVLSGTADDSCGQGTHSLQLALREARGGRIVALVLCIVIELLRTRSRS